MFGLFVDQFPDGKTNRVDESHASPPPSHPVFQPQGRHFYIVIL